MQIPRSAVVGFLREHGKGALADQAEQHLPEQIDPAQYAKALERYGVDVPTLVAKLAGPFKGLFDR